MTDHRAAAEEYLGHARAADPADELGHLQYALVHATLAGPPVRTVEIVADHTARQDLETLRRAVREYLATWTSTAPAETARDRLRKLVEVAS